MTDTLRVTLGETQLAVDVDGDQLRIGEVTGSDVDWWDERVPLADIGGEARQALKSGDSNNPALAIALTGLSTAIRDRGA